MFYDTVFWITLTIFGLGLVYKVSSWFFLGSNMHNRDMPGSVLLRTWTTTRDLLSIIFSSKFLLLIKVFVMKVLFQVQILKEDILSWLMHMLLFIGFMFLFFMHALDKVISTSLFDKYYLEINPFLIIAGVLIIIGILISLYRRFSFRVPRLKTKASDYYAIIILLAIIISGIGIELTKLTSYNHYQKIWYIHVTVVFLGLAYLPFSKMLHIFTVPASLLSNAVMTKNSNLSNIIVRQMMELDACTQCGKCSTHCSVSVAFDNIGNENILPSERMTFIKKYFTKSNIGKKELLAVQEGICLCTNCDRCTVICPSGINLRDLWFAVREEILQHSYSSVVLILTPFSYYRGLNIRKINSERYEKPLEKITKSIANRYKLLHTSDEIIPLNSLNLNFKNKNGLSIQIKSYLNCFACENCSTVCPVVGNYEYPKQHLDLLPHQIMRSLGFGILDLALGSRMLWYCLTCYQCQEHCPQGVDITDIFYELKNFSANELGNS